MSTPRMALQRARTRESGTPIAVERGLAAGFLSMTPLFLLYEIALVGGVSWRNSAEFVATAPLRAWTSPETAWRWALLCAAVVLAARAVFDARFGLVSRVGRTLAEGFIGALVLGPVAFLLARTALGPERFAALGASHESAAPLEVAAFVVGGAAWEELLFRVALQSAVFVLARETFEFLLGSVVLARAAADVVSIVLSAVAFAAAHLAGVLSLFSSGGEPFDAGVFAWRFLAGVSLGVLFRWRGPGVAAWTHAFANLALFVGAGPQVFL